MRPRSTFSTFPLIATPSSAVARRYALAVAALLLLASPGAVRAQVDARAAEIVETAVQKQFERWEGVDDYTVYGWFGGNDFVEYYEKITVDGRPAFRIVPPRARGVGPRRRDAGGRIGGGR